MNCNAIFTEAMAAGDAAFTSCRPQPVVFGQAVGFFGNAMVPGTERLETEGLCGFAWVEVRPTRSEFASWLRKNGKGRYDEYSRCVKVSSNASVVGGRSQSYDRKCAWAHAFAEVLQSHGIRAYSADRLD